MGLRSGSGVDRLLFTIETWQTVAMRSFPARVRVIVEQTRPGRWSASFAGVPAIAASGKSSRQAIERLFSLVGDAVLNVDEISSIDDATRDGHLEFRIPLLNRRLIPVPSVN